MAKKDTVFIDIQTSDGGSMQRVAVSAKKLGLALDDVGKASTRTGKSSRDADRNLKGLSQQSANSTKNFSKMAQGMTGTLVPAYAVLASNVFAITAAFQFLKSAADFRVMQDAQVAFTGATGVGMQSLTKNVQEASGMMLEFKAASEAASIGIASGLGAGQIEQLAAGAGNLSKILGRDVTDSFNRLIRGVTKAEPELLDELGIILRLNDAQENYATSLNKSAQDLSNYEKKQAVFVEVQTQLEAKYGAVAKATDVQVNAVSRLGIEFDRVMKHVKTFTASIAEPTAKFLTENILGLTAALALMAVPILKAIIPGLDSWAEKSKQSALEAGEAYDAAQKEIEELEAAQERLRKKAGPQGAAQAAGKAKKGSGLEMLQTGDTETLRKDKRRVSQMLRHAEKGNGAVRNMNKRQKQDYIAMLKGMQRGHNTTMEKIGMGWRKMTAGAGLQMKKMKAQWSSTMAAMQSGFAKMSGKVDKLFRAAGWIGMLILAYELSMQFAKSLGFFKESEVAKNLALTFEDIAESLSTVTEEYKKFNDIQRSLTEGGQSGLSALEAQGNFFAGITPSIIDASQAMADFHNGSLLASKGIVELTDTEKERMAALEARVKREKQPGNVKRGPNWQNRKPVDPLEDSERAELTRLKLQQDTFDLYQKDASKVADKVKELGTKFSESTVQVRNFFKALGDKATSNQKEFLDLLNQQIRLNEKGESLDDAKIARLKELSEGFQELGQQAGFVKQQEAELTKQYTSAINSITKYSTSVSSLEQLMEDQIGMLTRLKKARKDLAGEADASIAVLTKQLEVLNRISRVEIQIANNKLRIEKAFQKALHGSTTLQAQELGILQKIAINKQDIVKYNNEISVATTEAKNTESERVTQLELQRDKIIEQNEQLAEQLGMMFQIGVAGKQAFETGMQGAISSLMKGEESSFKDAMLKMGKSVVDSMIDAFSKNLTGKIMGFLKMKTEGEILKEQILAGHTTGAETLKLGLENGVDTATGKMKKALDESADRFSNAIKDACSSSNCMGASHEGEKPAIETVDEGPPGGILPPGALRYALDNPGVQVTPDTDITAVKTEAQTVVALDDTTVAKLGGDSSAIPGGEPEGFREGLVSSHGTPIVPDSPEEGEGEGGLQGVMTALTGETAKMVAGLGLAVSTLLGNSKAAQAVQKALALMTAITQAKVIWDKLNALRDKIMGKVEVTAEAANTLATQELTAVMIGKSVTGTGHKTGLYPPLGYASGGVARGPRSGYPAVLHGNEAVVPLPDGRSIPVDMSPGKSAGGAQNNNVAVTINMDSQGGATSETDSTSQNMSQLGERIAEMIQEELVNQKRNGGILSPYGAV